MKNKKRLSLLKILTFITTASFLGILFISLFTGFQTIFFVLLGASLSCMFLTWGAYFTIKAKQ